MENNKAAIEELTPNDISDGSTVELLDALNGLVFYNSLSELKPDGVRDQGIVAGKVTWAQTEDFKKVFGRYLNKPVSIRVLDELVQEVVIYARAIGHPVVDVFVPVQDITTGTVQVVIFEGRVGDVLLEGNEWFDDDVYLSKITLKEGDFIERDALLDDVNWINKNPFRQATVAFKRGRKDGSSDIVVKTNERRPLQIYSGFENTGSHVTDRGRIFSGLVWGNVFNWDHRFSIQGTMNPDYRKFKAISANYTIPLPWRHSLSIFASFAKSGVEPGDTLRIDGRSGQLGSVYEIELPDIWDITHRILWGTDFKRTNNNLEFSGSQISDTYADIVQTSLSYYSTINDPWGSTNLDLQYVFSPGDVSKHNNNVDFNSVFENVQADYQYFEGGIDRSTQLLGLTHRIYIRAQWADAGLMSSEQLGLGGAGTIRGYEERSESGDKGYYMNNEILTRFYKLHTKRKLGRAQFLTFWDYGKVSNNTTRSGEHDGRVFSSAGLGMRYRLNPTIIFNCDYGRQLRRLPNSETDGGRAHMYLVLYY